MGTTAKMTIRHTPKTYNLGDGSSNPEEWKVILGGIKLVGSFRTKEAAERLRDSYNEYDTLKARAELFDEAIELLDKANRRVIADNQSVPDRHYPFEVTVPAGELLSKARELK